LKDFKSAQQTQLSALHIGKPFAEKHEKWIIQSGAKVTTHWPAQAADLFQSGRRLLGTPKAKENLLVKITVRA
jgi:hypothetical protein